MSRQSLNELLRENSIITIAVMATEGGSSTPETIALKILMVHGRLGSA